MNTKSVESVLAEQQTSEDIKEGITKRSLFSANSVASVSVNHGL